MTNFLYNPDRKSKEQLKAEFVVRTNVLEDIMQDIENSSMITPEQHYLLVGQRGTGKTTLLHRIKYAIEDNPNLSEWLIPVIFSEEQYNISELANLWENVAHNLEDYHGFDGISKKMEEHIAKDNFEEICYDILEKYLKQYEKKLILLIDNIGDLLKKLEDKEVRRLRELLQTKAPIRLIAGSPFYLDSILDYKQAFFEFFKVIRLDGLNKNETEELLLKLGEIYNEKEKIEKIIKESPGRVETLRILTGGVPRTLALMFKIFTDYEHESSVKDLERILDLVTPLYKHRMDDLPKQQQKIVDAVAKKWEAISVKELKERVRLESKVISAQLRQLEKNQIIEKRETDTKNHNYLIKERFFNIWYLMRYGRKDTAESVKWLVSFMESWYDKNELDTRIDKYIKEVMLERIDNHSGIFYANVYSETKNVSTTTRSKLSFSLSKIMNGEQDRINNEQITEAYDKNNFETVVKLCLESHYITDANKSLILISIDKLLYNNSIFIADLTEKYFESEYLEKSHKGKYGFFYCFIAITLLIQIRALAKKEFEMLEDTVKISSSLICSINNTFGEDFFSEYFKFERVTFQSNLIMMLASNSVTILKSIFETDHFAALKEIYKPIYYAILVIEDKKIFATLGDELKIPVQSVLDDIQKQKEIITKNR